MAEAMVITLAPSHAMTLKAGVGRGEGEAGDMNSQLPTTAGPLASTYMVQIMDILMRVPDHLIQDPEPTLITINPLRLDHLFTLERTSHNNPRDHSVHC